MGEETREIGAGEHVHMSSVRALTSTGSLPSAPVPPSCTVGSVGSIHEMPRFAGLTAQPLPLHANDPLNATRSDCQGMHGLVVQAEFP